MRALTAPELLDAWERGFTQSPPERALTLLAAAGGGREALARLPVGERDRRLLDLRERTFGARLDALAACGRCGERLEMSFDVADVRVAPEGDDREAGGGDTRGGDDTRGGGDKEGDGAKEMFLSVGGYEVKFRPPNSLDLLALAPTGDADAARRAILSRCLLSAVRGGEGVGADALPEEVAGAVADALAEADPQADVELALACPRCGNSWSESLDVVAFLWGEVDAWAVRTLGEVHALALAYGWGEREILSMSAWRRQFYLKMVNA